LLVFCPQSDKPLALKTRLKEMNFKKISEKTLPANEYTQVISTYKNTAGDIVTYINHPYNESNNDVTNDLIWTGNKLYTAEEIMNFMKSHKSQIEDFVSNSNGTSTPDYFNVSWDGVDGHWDNYGGQGFQRDIQKLKAYTGSSGLFIGKSSASISGYNIISGKYTLDYNYRHITYRALAIKSPKGKMYKLCLELSPSKKDLERP
jgi:hypothetical protein